MAGAIAVATAAPGKGRTGCSAGRYLVLGEALIAGDTAVPREPVIVDGVRISIGNVCPSTRGKVGVSLKGTTVKAKWARCGAQKKVRLRASIDASCQSLRGTLKAKGQPARPVEALLSVCGDSIVDPGNIEACEPPRTTTCDAQCRVLIPQGTSTTSTTAIGSSTSTTFTTTTSSSASSTSTTLGCLSDLGLTVVDSCTGLEWEKKTTQNVANKYSIAGAATWLAQLNAAVFAGHADWRLPRIASVGPIATNDPAELETILTYGAPPRINPIFGPTAGESYWSSSTATPPPGYGSPGAKYRAGIDFGTGFPFFGDLSFAAHVRAVRYASGVDPRSTTTSTIPSSSTSSTTTSSTATTTSTGATSASTTSLTATTTSSTSTSSSTTLPAACGDGTLNQVDEECDGEDAVLCPGGCTVACTCPNQPARVVLRVMLAQVGGRPAHEGFVPTASQPVIGQSAYIVASVLGPYATATFRLVDPDGEPIRTVDLAQNYPQAATADHVGKIDVPDQPFKVAVSGTTRDGSPYDVIDGTVFTPQPIGLTWDPYSSGTLSAGGSATLHFDLVNHGESDTFEFAASDIPGLTASVTPGTATVARDETLSVSVDLTAAPGLQRFWTADVSLTVHSTNHPEINTAFAVRVTLD